MNRRDQKNARIVEAEGFRDGTQNVESAIVVKEIDAQFARRQEEEDEGATHRIKMLEAQAETLARRKQDAERHWTNLESRTEGMPPQFMLPLFAVLFAIAAVIGEAVFLGPVMDGFGISDSTLQLIFAGVIVITTSGLFEITKKVYIKRAIEIETDESEVEHQTKPKSRRLGSLIFFGLLTTLAFALVFILGWWRAEEMIYAASVQTGAWREFLSNNPALTRVVVVLLTTAMPIFVALAFEWGLDGLHLAWEWRKSNAVHKRLCKQHAHTEKALEKENETRDARKRALTQMRDEWKQAYLQNHELGQKTGAWKLPLWWVVMKICVVPLLVIVFCLLVDPIVAQYILSDAMRWLLYGCLTAGLGVLYAAHAIRAWERPNPEQLFDHKKTIFRSELPPERTRFVATVPSHAEGNGKQPDQVKANAGSPIYEAGA
jgi:hypothetical protein